MNYEAEKYVCTRCIRDPCVAEFIEEHNASEKCSYCRSRERATYELSEVCGFIEDRVLTFYTTDPSEEGPLDKETGEFWGVEEDYIENILGEMELKLRSKRLMSDIVESIGNTEYYSKGSISGTPSQRAADAWEKFCNKVKHSRRFTFWTDSEFEIGIDINPSEMLKEITQRGEAEGLGQIYPAGTKWWKVRIHREDEPLEARPEEFTTVKTEGAWAANRMSPAGVPMFYGAEKFETACLEVVNLADRTLSKKFVTGAIVRTLRPMAFLDLTKAPTPRSEFEPWDEERWHDVAFLRHFVTDLSKPVIKDDKAHIEYVPTQAFTEYVRYEMQQPNGPMDGIVFPSSKDGSPCAVIFATREQCLPLERHFGEQLLEVDVQTIRSVPATEVRTYRKEATRRMRARKRRR